MAYLKKVVWITGASSGIGKALAIEYSKLDVILILSSRCIGELERVKVSCSNNENIELFHLDVTNSVQQEIIYNTIINKYGKIDILINNAGVSQRCLEDDTPMETYRKLMETNYFSIVSLTKLVLPQFKERNEGNIVTISSIAGLIGIPYRTGYCASKFAIEGFFASLRKELLNTKIKILMIQPIWINTNISINALIGKNINYKAKENEMKKAMNAIACARAIISSISGNKRNVIIGKNSFRNFLIKQHKIIPKFILNWFNI